jgi:hypothetical protein
MASLRSWRQAVDALLVDLRVVFEGRLKSFVVYEAHGTLGEAAADLDGELRHEDQVHTLVVADGLSYADLARLAPLAKTWATRGLAVPLVLEPGELRRSLDAFPLEFSHMIARHLVVAGDDPFEGLVVEEADIRRACETEARSHLLHLREGFIQAAGDPDALAKLVSASAVPLRALLIDIAQLQGVAARTTDALVRFMDERFGVPAESIRPALSQKESGRFRALEVGAFFPAYLRAVERVVSVVDEWTR